MQIIDPDSAVNLPVIKVTHAAVGVIQRDDGFVLLGERPIGKPWAGYWEFPGGKIEENETPECALNRELQEELGISVISSYRWLTRSFDYAAKYDATGKLESIAKTVKLHFFIVTEWQGEPFGLENQGRILKVLTLDPCCRPTNQSLMRLIWAKFTPLAMWLS
jgi:8-oxo-dGTP diphosphatase